MRRKKWVEGWLARDGENLAFRHVVFMPMKRMLRKTEDGWWAQDPLPMGYDWQSNGSVWRISEELFERRYGKIPWLKPGTKHLVDLEI